ncbi:MAG: hypothetical protein V1703_01430 [Candidatus Altiarchaeota archaeon]
MNDLVVYDGHFWVNIDGILSQKRKTEIKADLEKTDRLMMVDGILWARIETPHPTKRQKTLYKAPWKVGDIEARAEAKDN